MDGSDEAGEEVIENAIWDLAFTALVLGFGQAAKGIVRHMMGNHPAQEFGQEFVDKLLKNSDDITTAGRAIKKLRKLNVGDDVIRELGERFGQKGYDWLLNKQNLKLSDDIIKKLMKTDNFMSYSDDLLRAIQKSNGYADDIIRQVTKYGDDAADAIAKYGDDAVVIIGTYGDDAIGFINKYGDDAIDVIYKYEDDAIGYLGKGFNPDEINGIKGVCYSWNEFDSLAKSIGKNTNLTNAEKVSVLQELFKNSNYKTDINVPSDVRYVKGFGTDGSVYYD